MNFAEWLLSEDAGSPGAKQPLYPLSYGGLGLYPPGDVLTWAADALTYMPKNARQLTFKWGDGMLANPFDKDSLYEKIKGKQAEQTQEGEVIQQNVICTGNLAIDDAGFKKTKYIQDAPKPKMPSWDYKQMGDIYQ